MPCFFKGETLNLNEMEIDRRFQNDLILEPQKFWQVVNQDAFWIAGHTTLYRKDILLHYGGFPERLAHLADWLLHYKIASYHPIGYVAQPLAALRCVAHSYSQRKMSRQHFLALIEFLEKDEGAFREPFRKFGGLKACGLSIVPFLLRTPFYWKYLTPIVQKHGWNFLRRKIRKIFCR
jgi:hypothetical protein